MRTVLAPAGHAPVDEALVAGQARVGPDPEALGHAGAEALDQPVGRSTRSSTSSTASGFFRSMPTEGRDRLSRSQ